MKQAVTREQLASILYRLSGKPAVSASLRSYTDASDVSAYAVDAMRWAVGCGYLKGSGAKLNLQTGANRAEVAVLLHRYLTNNRMPRRRHSSRCCTHISENSPA